MKRVAIVIAAAALAARGARAEVSVVGSDRTVEVDCASDPAIRLIGNHITLAARGVCQKITVSGNHDTITARAAQVRVAGNHNTVTLAGADDVTVDGNRNTVTVHAPIKLAAPRIAVTGSDNRVTAPR